jgi:hypothetical protein
MNTAPGGDAMTGSFHRDAELAALKRETVPRPQAWRIRQTEVGRLAADSRHCETRKCREPVVIVTRRWWRAADVGRVLLAEHLVCERHGAEFAARYHIGVDPAGEVAARHLSDVEMLAFWVDNRHCDWPACKIAATWIFTETFTVRGEPRSDQDLSCDRHARAFADRFHISMVPAPDEGGAR